MKDIILTYKVLKKSKTDDLNGLICYPLADNNYGIRSDSCENQLYKVISYSKNSNEFRIRNTKHTWAARIKDVVFIEPVFENKKTEKTETYETIKNIISESIPDELFDLKQLHAKSNDSIIPYYPCQIDKEFQRITYSNTEALAGILKFLNSQNEKVDQYEFILHYPEETVSDGFLTHTVKDVFIKFILDISVDVESKKITYIKSQSVEVARTTGTVFEHQNTYILSHRDGGRLGSWSIGCCFGSGLISEFYKNLHLSNVKNIDMFFLDLYHIFKSWIKWESTEGGPYRRISSVEVNKNNFKGQSAEQVPSSMLEAFVLKYIAENKNNVIKDIRISVDNINWIEQINARTYLQIKQDFINDYGLKEIFSSFCQFSVKANDRKEIKNFIEKNYPEQYLLNATASNNNLSIAEDKLIKEIQRSLSSHVVFKNKTVPIKIEKSFSFDENDKQKSVYVANDDIVGCFISYYSKLLTTKFYTNEWQERLFSKAIQGI